MLFENDFRIRMRDIGKDNKASNAGIMSIMEETATLHSYDIGFAVNQCLEDNKSWILLDWDIRIIRRPEYNESVKTLTWTRKYDKITAYRDFQIKDTQGNVLVAATSRWLLMDIVRRRPCRLTEDITKKYESEPEHIAVCDDIEKINYPMDADELKQLISGADIKTANDKYNEYNVNTVSYKVLKRDIDFNGHVHNLVYLDMALEALPDNISDTDYSAIRIEYKKEIMPKADVLCTYCRYDNSDIVIISTDNIINCIVKFT